jgi:sugar lactone lactonase YvrE
VFVGYVLPSTRQAEPPLAGPRVPESAHQVMVTDHAFSATVVQTIPGFLTDEEGNLTPNSPNLPADVVSMDGKLFVLDTNRGRILTVTADGQLARIFESDPDGQSSVARATAMTSHGSDMYVAAPLFGNVIELNAAGRVDSVVQPQLPKAPRPFMPAGIAVTDKGDIWLSDANNRRVMLFNDTGSLITTIGYGARTGSTDEFDAPAGIALDAKGNLFVADSHRHEVREYAPDGRFVAAIGQDALSVPRDVTIDGLGRIFVTDQVLREVRVFGSDGLFLGSIGLAPDVPGGASDSGLQYPHGLEVHGDQLFVMDRLSGMFVYKLGGAP